MEDNKPAEQPICNGRNKGECEHGTLVQEAPKNATKSFIAGKLQEAPKNATKSFGDKNETKSFGDDKKNATKSFGDKNETKSFGQDKPKAKKNDSLAAKKDVEAPLHKNGSSITFGQETPKNATKSFGDDKNKTKSLSHEEPKKEGSDERTRTHKYPNGLATEAPKNDSKMAKKIPDAKVEQVKKALKDNDTLIISQDFTQTHNVGMFAQITNNLSIAFHSFKKYARQMFGLKN